MESGCIRTLVNHDRALDRIETVVDTAANFDFAILVLTPDDTTIRRGTSEDSPRGNLFFELGLFTES